MEEDEEIKIKKNNEADYDDFSLNDMKKEIENLEEKLAYLRNLLKQKKTGQNKADKLFKK